MQVQPQRARGRASLRLSQHHECRQVQPPHLKKHLQVLRGPSPHPQWAYTHVHTHHISYQTPK